MPSDCLKIIESKSKVCQSRAKTVVAKVNSSSPTPAISSDVAELKDMVRALLLDKKNQSSAPAPSHTPALVKAVESNCVTCGGTHSYQNCPATSGNVYQDNIKEYVSQAAATNYNQGNTGFRPQMVANLIRPLEFPPVQNNQNNFNRGNNFNQNQGGNFNQSNFNQSQLHRPQVNQPPAYQAPAYQAPIPQTQSVSQTDFEGYVKANDAVLRNIQSQGQRSGTLPGNTITNPKEDLKGITTRSVVAYQRPIIPTPSKVVKQGTEVTKDQVQTPSSQSTAPVQPPVTQSETPVSEPVVAPFNRSVSKPIDIAKDVSVKVGMFYFPADFVVVDFEPDHRVPLIRGKCFLKTGRALIDVHKGKLTLRIGNEVITYNLDQTSRYSANYDQMTANKIDVTDEACEEYSQEVLSFFDVTASISPTPSDDLIVSTTSPMLTPFGDSDFLLFKEADAFLSLEDDPDSPKFDLSYYDPEGDILMLEAILNSDPAPSLPDHEQAVPSFKNELKSCEAKSIKSSVNEPPEVELKDLPPHLEYAFLEGDKKLHVIMAKELGDEEKATLIKDYKPAVQHQRRVNPKIHDVIKKEVEKLLDAGLIYPIYDSPWVSPVHCVPKKGGFTVVKNEENELIPTRLVTRWRGTSTIVSSMVSLSIFKFPSTLVIRKNNVYCPYGMFAYRRMPFGLCNAPGTFQMCMLAIFHDMVEKMMEVFMDDFSVFGNSFKTCLSRLDKMLQRCEDTKLCLNWEKSHFMVKEGIVLGHKILRNGIEVDKAKVDVITKLPHPTTVKGVQSFLVHAGFYRRFIKDFSKISRPMTHLLEKDTPFIFSKDCIKAFQTLKQKPTEAPILIAPNWDLPFELMCDASDFAIGAVLGQRYEKHFWPIHYASKTLTEAESNYTMTKKEMLAVVYAFEKFQSYLIMNKCIVHTDHSALKYLFAKKDAKARLLRWVLLLQEFDFDVFDTKGAENLAADHLSRLETLSSGPPFTKMPTSLSKTVTRANDKEKFHNVMKCLIIPSKFVKSLTFGALTLWARSRLHEGTNIFSWPSIICRNGLKRKRSPPVTPKSFASSLNRSSPDLVPLELS
nr:reverse transcriptase domain-containing protein [Tanacetum cinerariifolium]